jgi:hypothetical protein
MDISSESPRVWPQTRSEAPTRPLAPASGGFTPTRSQGRPLARTLRAEYSAPAMAEESDAATFAPVALVDH